jgi:hypothetical protein
MLPAAEVASIRREEAMPVRRHSRSRFVRVLLVVGMLLLVPWSSRVHAADLQQAVYEGTLGNQRVGLILIMDGGRIAGGRYYYLRHLMDIPLIGERKAGSITLREPAATFTLHFVGNGSEQGHALDFDNSVGLEGTWSKGTKNLSVKLDGGGLTPAAPEHRWYQSITDQTDEVFEARSKGFYAAVLKGDSGEAARYVHFPLRVNTGPRTYELIRNRQQLAAAWPRIFTPDYLAAVSDASPHAMAVVQGYAMLGDGLVYFSDKGAEVVNLP